MCATCTHTTPNSALAIAGPGDTILVAGGNYSWPSMTVTTDGLNFVYSPYPPPQTQPNIFLFPHMDLSFFFLLIFLQTER